MIQHLQKLLIDTPHSIYRATLIEIKKKFNKIYNLSWGPKCVILKNSG